MKVIGLTGGIGSGKSTVARFFEACGAVHIDADQVAHEIYDKSPQLLEALVQSFGKSILDQTGKKIDRAALAKIVFKNAQDLKTLERMVHPLIRLEIEKKIESARKAHAPLVIVDAALLIETGFYKNYDGLIVVKADEDTQINRVQKRDECSQKEVLQRMKHQLPLNEKLKVANWLIDNSGELKETQKQTETLYRKMIEIP